VVLSARDAAKAERAARSLSSDGDVSSIVLDVTRSASIERARHDLESRFGRVDILVNNAAILVAEGDSLLDTSPEDIERTFETNVFGAIRTAQAFVPGMVARRFGRVVNVSSRAGQLASMGTYAPAYAMSKTALNGFTKALSAGTHGTGVLVNAACPGWVRTDMGGQGAPRSVEQGADTIVWLATLPPDGPSGGFFADRKAIGW
jgi:NAD(P)-dependent dehydrogenase (short-subunit alcohol dehydrogenase family)